MSALMKALGIDKMSAAERLRLLEEIWDSLTDRPEDIPLTDAQRAELDRRIAAHEANPAAGSPWDEVKHRLQRRP